MPAVLGLICTIQHDLKADHSYTLNAQHKIHGSSQKVCLHVLSRIPSMPGI